MISVPARKASKKVRKTVSLDPELLRWVATQIGTGKRFSSLTHAVETGLVQLRERV